MLGGNRALPCQLAGILHACEQIVRPMRRLPRFRERFFRRSCIERPLLGGLHRLLQPGLRIVRSLHEFRQTGHPPVLVIELGKQPVLLVKDRPQGARLERLFVRIPPRAFLALRSRVDFVIGGNPIAHLGRRRMVCRTANGTRLACNQVRRQQARAPGTLQFLQLVKPRSIVIVRRLGLPQIRQRALIRPLRIGRSIQKPLPTIREFVGIGHLPLRRVQLGLRLHQARRGIRERIASRLRGRNGSMHLLGCRNRSIAFRVVFSQLACRLGRLGFPTLEFGCAGERFPRRIRLPPRIVQRSR
jgi:hypothetical protein